MNVIHKKLIVIVVLLFVVVGLVYTGVIPATVNRGGGISDEETRDPSSMEEARQDDTAFTESSCASAGGTWNPCGSACRTKPDAVCIELCVEYCECESDLQCPSGFTCGEFVEGVGVCL